MSYGFTQGLTNFHISAEQQPLALQALKDTLQRNYHDLEEALMEDLWDVQTHEGDIFHIRFESDNYFPEMKQKFDIIAPYVTENSFITMHGDCGDAWRWLFKNGKCIEQEGRLVFEDVD